MKSVIRALISLELFIRIRPIFLFQLSQFLLSQKTTLTSIFTLLASYVLSNFLIRVFLVRSDNKMLVDASNSFLKEGYRLKQIQVERLLSDEETKSYMSAASGHFSFRRHGKSADGKINAKLYGLIKDRTIVAVVEPEASEPAMTHPISYPLSSGGIIFLHQVPERLRGLGRHATLHEFGHLATIANYSLHRAEITQFVFASSILYTACYFGSSSVFGYLYILYVVMFAIVAAGPWRAYRDLAKLEAECTADHFAFECAGEADKRAAARMLIKYDLSHKQLIGPFDTLRRNYVRESAESVLSGSKVVHPMSYSPVGGDTSNFVWVGLLSLSVLGAVSRPLDDQVVQRISLFLAAVSLYGITLLTIKLTLKSRLVSAIKKEGTGLEATC